MVPLLAAAATKSEGHNLTEGCIRRLCHVVPGPAVMDASPLTMLNYAQGSTDLLLRDFSAVLPPPVVQRLLEACRECGVHEALAVRLNLINFKKACLKLWKKCDENLLGLRRLSTAFFSDGWQSCESGAAFDHSTRYTEVATEMSRCKGALEAIHDARDFTKLICCTPRHPDMSQPARLLQLPQSLRAYKALERALNRLGEHELPSLPSPPSPPTLEPDELADLLLRLEAIAGEAGDPESIRRFLRQVLIARGVSKAFRIRRALADYSHSLQWMVECLDQLVSPGPTCCQFELDWSPGEVYWGYSAGWASWRSEPQGQAFCRARGEPGGVHRGPPLGRPNHAP